MTVKEMIMVMIRVVMMRMMRFTFFFELKLRLGILEFLYFQNNCLGTCSFAGLPACIKKINLPIKKSF